jgi:hypothetical protein
MSLDPVGSPLKVASMLLKDVPDTAEGDMVVEGDTVAEEGEEDEVTKEGVVTSKIAVHLALLKKNTAM